MPGTCENTECAIMFPPEGTGAARCDGLHLIAVLNPDGLCFYTAALIRVEIKHSLLTDNNVWTSWFMFICVSPCRKTLQLQWAWPEEGAVLLKANISGSSTHISHPVCCDRIQMVIVATEVAFICKTLRWSAMFACERTKRGRHHRLLLLRFSQLCQFVQNMCEAD